MEPKIKKSDNEWREILSPEEYEVLRQKATEKPFTGKYNNFKGEGIFVCAACGNPLFSSEHKYDSGSGWPSFYKPIEPERIAIEKDYSHRMIRDEALCSACGGHLGHVFSDGPQPTGQRYCINSVAMEFKGR